MALGVWRQITDTVHSIRFVRFYIRLKDIPRRKNSIALAIFSMELGDMYARTYSSLWWLLSLFLHYQHQTRFTAEEQQLPNRAFQFCGIFWRSGIMAYKVQREDLGYQTPG